MKFKANDFSCDVEKYKLDDKSFVVKFFDKGKEHSEEQICDYVLVEPGYGYICLKYKGKDALLSGFLNEDTFTDEMIQIAIDFVESLSPYSDDAYIPHNIMKVKITGTVEYNGEF